MSLWFIFCWWLLFKFTADCDLWKALANDDGSMLGIFNPFWLCNEILWARRSDSLWLYCILNRLREFLDDLLLLVVERFIARTILDLQFGHSHFRCNHSSIQSLWNTWPQPAISRTIEFFLKGSRQMEQHSFFKRLAWSSSSDRVESRRICCCDIPRSLYRRSSKFSRSFSFISSSWLSKLRISPNYLLYSLYSLLRLCWSRRFLLFLAYPFWSSLPIIAFSSLFASS